MGKVGGGGMGGEGYGTGGGMLLGGQALEISVVCFSSFQDGRGLEFEFEFGFGLVGWEVVGGLGNEPATAGSLLVSHGQKKAALDTAWLFERSTPAITQKNRNSEMCVHGWWHRLTEAYSQQSYLLILC